MDERWRDVVSDERKLERLDLPSANARYVDMLEN